MPGLEQFERACANQRWLELADRRAPRIASRLEGRFRARPCSRARPSAIPQSELQPGPPGRELSISNRRTNETRRVEIPEWTTKVELKPE